MILELAGLPVLRLEHALTRTVIAAIPSAYQDYRPEAGARTAAELARHIVNAELRFFNGVAAGTFDMGTIVDAGTDLESVVQTYEVEFPATLGRLTILTGEDLIRPLDYRAVVRMPALSYVQLAVNHSIHHCGQLSAYLRSVGEGAIDLRLIF